MLRSEKIRRKRQQQEEIAELKRRRVEMWKMYHNLPEDDERRPELKRVAQAIYDNLERLGHI
jgi:hypothetical protein